MSDSDNSVAEISARIAALELALCLLYGALSVRDKSAAAAVLAGLESADELPMNEDLRSALQRLAAQLRGPAEAATS